MIKLATVAVLAVLLAGCESDNEHFCARYEYMYDQLLEDDVPSYSEIKQQLQATLSNPEKDHDQPRFMLFVLEDWYAELKPIDEPAHSFCMRLQRWQAYP